MKAQALGQAKLRIVTAPRETSWAVLIDLMTKSDDLLHIRRHWNFSAVAICFGLVPRFGADSAT